jgi:hypothetical protein
MDQILLYHLVSPPSAVAAAAAKLKIQAYLVDLEADLRMQEAVAVLQHLGKVIMVLVEQMTQIMDLVVVVVLEVQEPLGIQAMVAAVVLDWHLLSLDHL